MNQSKVSGNKATMAEAPALAGLADEIARAWQTFSHSYTVRKKRKNVTEHWRCRSLKKACANYEFGGNSRVTTNDLLDPLSRKLKAALTDDGSDSHALHHLCLEVLEWGGVEGVSSKWLRERCADGSLKRKINAATNLLITAASADDLARFNGQDLVMNSGLTKIYALAAPGDVIIYDGRIGGALGLFATRYCESIGYTKPTFRCGHKLSAVPPVLQFPWGDGLSDEGSRNPSVAPHLFPQLRPGSARAHLIHADACRKASYVLRKVVATLGMNGKTADGKTVSLRDIEMALFMVGYHVKRMK